MLRILIQDRADSDLRPGGDTVVVSHTEAFLRAHGFAVRRTRDPYPNLDNVDVVHLFNLTRPRELAARVEHAERAGRPYVLTPIYWDLQRAVPWTAYESPRCWRVRITPDWLRDRLAREAAQGPLQRRSQWALQRRLLEGARLVLPGSDAEAAHLAERLGPLPAGRVRVVLHGVDPPWGLPRSEEAAPAADPDTLLCAGSIGPRKNQLGIVRAFQELRHLRLHVVGDAAEASDRYPAAVRRAAGSNVTFAPAVPHSEMGALLAAVGAVVQASFVETPGLVALEARAIGVPVVAADLPPVREYLGDDPGCFFCDPASPASIADACRGAQAAGRVSGAALLRQYSWSTVLSPMREAYAALEAELEAELAAGRPSVGPGQLTSPAADITPREHRS